MQKNNIHILQDITVQLNTNEQNVPKRITSSMYFFDEEPAFSESSEDEYETKIELVPKDPPVVIEKTFHDVGVQCDILKEENTILGMIKACANLELAGEYEELITACKKIEARQYFSINEDAICNFSSFEDEKQNDFAVPFSVSRSGGTNFNTTSKKKKTKINQIIRRSYRERRPPKRSIVERRLTTNEIKELAKLTNERQKKNSVRQKKEDRLSIENTLLINGGKRTQKLPQKANIGNNDTFFKRINNLNSDIAEKNSEEILNKSMSNIPKRVAKCLARNWMKPNKSLSLLDETIQNEQNYLSLQHTKKMRRLYSPTQWMDEWLASHSP